MRKQTAWNKHLMVVFRQMKARNKNVKLHDAMIVASRSYKG